METNVTVSQHLCGVPQCTLVIFGISGDLTHRLLMPALYNLARLKRLPKDFRIIGVGRSAMAVER
ncbi:hypothetical protein WDZ92_53035, partial [Nostoc sp. NIES-2111]